VGFVVDGAPFTAQVLNASGVPLALRSTDQQAQLEALLKAATFRVDNVTQDSQPVRAPNTLTAAALMERAGHELDLSPDRMLALAEILYEAGWITYPLAEAATLAPETVEAARDYIRRTYGNEYVPPEANEHGGIKPTDVNRVPEALPGHGAALYTLIWRHNIAAQMSPALQRVARVHLLAESASGKPYPIQLRAEGRMRLFDGWQQVFGGETADAPLPALTEGMTLQAALVQIDAVTSAPPVPYRPHTLVRSLSRIGMPISAAAQAVESLSAAGYLMDQDGGIGLTTQGRDLVESLDSSFDELTSIEYRTQLSADLERIAAGTLSRDAMLREFWTRFGGTLPLTETGSIVGAHKPVLLRPAKEI
jgi:DNA topoisomerase-1